MALPSPGISTRTPPDTVCLILAFGIPNSGRLILLRAVVKTSALLLLLPEAIVIVIAALLGGLTVGLFFLLFPLVGGRFLCSVSSSFLFCLIVSFFFFFFSASFSLRPTTCAHVPVPSAVRCLSAFSVLVLFAELSALILTPSSLSPTPCALFHPSCLFIVFWFGISCCVPILCFAVS